MIFTFLGTSAGEEYPGIWCSCINCAKARKLGGKNLRRNSCAVIDSDVMLDIGKTAHIQAERYGKDLTDIRTLLVTHSHNDHFNIHTLWARQMVPGYDKLHFEEQKKLSSPRFSSLKTLDIFGSSQVERALRQTFFSAKEYYVNLEAANINFNLIEPYKSYKAHNLKFFTLEGNHRDVEGVN